MTERLICQDFMLCDSKILWSTCQRQALCDQPLRDSLPYILLYYVACHVIFANWSDLKPDSDSWSTKS